MLSIVRICSGNFLKLKTLNIGHLLPVKNVSTAKYALLAGHSKWANIRHIKAAKDGQKATLFTKISRQIRLAIQDGGSADPSLNSQLKSIIDEALRKNMPMASIQNSIQKCKQSKDILKRYKLDLRYKQKVFAVCIIYTDNYPGVKMDMATVLRKSGATILDANHLFEEIGLVQAVIDKSRLQHVNDLEDVITEDAIKFGAEEIEILDKENGVVNFICRPFEIMALRKSLEANGYVTDNTEHIYIPLNIVELHPDESIEYQKFVTKLKEIPGVEEIYDNINAI
ncbi:probable transcriptional regulatory protein Nmul_A2722 [Calliphora vicina]|uniref:probable transcriptional regulatory protein Nmul_A2722 n=1 Tax=Calliphora vicina TaxID=7373 RepID=UPI00325AC82D